MAVVHRVVTDPFPGLSALAELVDLAHPEDLEELIALKSETDDVVRSVAIAAVSNVPSAQRYVGRHAAVVMAPFMWAAASRFSPGTFGVLYTALDRQTAIRESAYHATKLLTASLGAPPARLPRVALTLDLDDRGHADFRHARIAAGGRSVPGDSPTEVASAVYDPNDYRAAQIAGAQARAAGHDGIRYDSVRSAGGECFATFRPTAIRTVRDDAVTIELDWNGTAIETYAEIRTFRLSAS